MKHADIKAMMAEIAPVIREFTASAIGPIVGRMEALEKEVAALASRPAPRDADEKAIAARVHQAIAADLAEVKQAVESIVIPELPEMPDVASMIAEARSADAAASEARFAEVEAKIAAISAIPAPEAGKDADPEEMRAAVASEVQRAVAALPVPEDGKSVTVDDVRPLIEEAVSKAVSSIRIPEDGCGIKELLIDRNGALVATMDDGRVKSLGIVVGKDADEKAIERTIAEKFAALPKPRDGFSLEDFDADLLPDGRTVLLSFTQGDIKHSVELGFPAMIYRGVYKEGAEYERGDCVTWGGSLWHCDVDQTAEKPDSQAKHWTLATKRGRDGKDKT